MITDTHILTYKLSCSCHGFTVIGELGQMSKPKKTLPRGIDQLPSGYYRARVAYQGSMISLGTFRTIGDATAARAIALSELARDTFIPPAQRRAQHTAQKQQAAETAVKDSRTVGELATAWLTWLQSIGRSTGTLYTYERRLKQSFLKRFKNTPVVEITVEDVTNWYNRLVKSNGEGVAKQHYRTVDGMFRYATGKSKQLPRSFDPWIKDSPVDIPGAGSKKRSRRKDEVVITPAEMYSIANNMPPHERLGILLGGWCALRIGEVLGLRRQDFSTDQDGVMWVSVNEQVQGRGTPARLDPTKTEAGDRVIPVASAIVPDVEAHLADHVGQPGNSFLFPRDPIGNRPHHPNTFRDHFNTARDKTNNPRFKDLTFHGLRHSCLTRLGRAGATLSDLMAFAGHSDVESVLIYQHSERQRLAALAEQLSTTV